MVFDRALCDRGLNSIPKWCGTPMARGSRLQPSAWHHRKRERDQPAEFRGTELATSQWMVPYVKTIKVLNSGSVLIVFNSSLTSEWHVSRRARHTLFCGCFLPDQSKLSGFRQKMTGHHQISWRRRNFVNHQKYRHASSICTCFLDQELLSYTMRYLLHFKKVYFSK